VEVCRLCGAARDYFPPAWHAEGEHHGLRFCASCDDIAELQFYRRCHACGHDYGEGIIPEEPPAEERENHERVRWALYLLLGGAGLLAAYFYWLMRR
jgi:hypothetical protein